MKYRVIILDPGYNHIFDEKIDSEDYKVSGGIFAIKLKEPILIGGLVIEPDPDKPKITFQEVSEETKKEVL